jgi:hypothetical protein
MSGKCDHEAGQQNFDPDWAKHLKHDPDKPQGVGVPGLNITWEDCFGPIRAQKDAGPEPQTHNEESRETIKGQEHGQVSNAWISITLTIKGTDKEQTFPCQTATTVYEIMERLAYTLSCDPFVMKFVQKQGCIYRQMYPHEQVARKMMVMGIKSFKRLPMKYDHPRVIIGAGHLGLRMAMFMVERKQLDFVVFDRMDRVGGTSWLYQANSTSKLQTEYGAYHLNFGEDFPIPDYFTTPWPSRNALLAMFQREATNAGIMPYMKFKTNAKNMNVILKDKSFTGPKVLQTERYELTTEFMGQGRLKYGKIQNASEADEGKEEIFNAGTICFFPGNLTLPRQEVYKGEEVFGGEIGYGMFNEINYHLLERKNVCIIGHGAFAVENIRTCVEFNINQMYLVCRRANLSCPRVASWMANRSLNPLQNARYMKVTEPMYDLIGRDPWSYYSVQANEKKTICQITQKARFGIGDIYFLAIYMKKVELVIDPQGVKRVSKGEVHLMSGRKLACDAILKLLGLIGEMDNDRLMKVKEMVGFWANGDARRYLVAEPVSVMCSQMGGTSFSPGAYSWSLQGLYFLDYPVDFTNGPEASGMLPRHKVDMGDDNTPRPAHVVDARHGTQTGMTIGMFTPALQEVEANSGFVKAVRHRLCHPIKKFLAQAREDWDYYAQKMLDMGFGKDLPYPTYPYTCEMVKAAYTTHMEETQEPMLPCDAEDWALAVDD